MKVLIGYDGSACADATLADLTRAGLPHDAHIRVLTVADVYMPHPSDAEVGGSRVPAIAQSRVLAQQAFAAAQEMAANAADRVRALGGWEVSHDAVADTPAWGLVKYADGWEPDLVMVGSQGKSVLRRLALGSVSASVLEHATCSVRVARTGSRDEPGATQAPVRLLIGIDGSIGSATAVDAVSMRAWPAGSEAVVMFVLDLRTVTSILSAAAGNGGDVRKYAEDAAEQACVDLREVGLSATPVVVEGDVRDILAVEATRLKVDCIFLGAKGRSMIQRFLLGSVSSAVAVRATCSVEVVRFPTS